DTIAVGQTQVGGGTFGGAVTTGGLFGAGGILTYDGTTVTLNVNAGTGTNTFNINGTGATANTPGSSGTTVTAGAGGATFDINGDNLSGANSFVGTGSGNAFTLNIVANIGQNAVVGGPILGLTMNGGAGGTSDTRNTVSINDASAAPRNLNFQYLAGGATTG